MRHAAELYLKAAIRSIHSLGDRSKGLPLFDMEGSHDIGRIWGYFREHALSIDRRYRAVVEQLDDAIGDIASVDPTGQVFRYPFGRENNKHLTDISIINCRILKTRFEDLRARLAKLGRLNGELESEYYLGTFTSRLSRLDLLCIASMLPPRSDWRTEAFEEAREKVRTLFNISSGEFSRALCRIQDNREMASLLGVPLKFEHCAPEQFFAFFDAWFHLNGTAEVNAWLGRKAGEVREFGLEDTQDMFSNLPLWIKRREDAWNVMEEKLSLEAIGEIDALFNFSRTSHPYCESFDRERIALTRNLEAERRVGEESYRNTVFNFMEKFVVLPDVLNSLNLFGHRDLVDSLLDRYKLAEHAVALIEPSNHRIRDRAKLIQETLDALGAW